MADSETTLPPGQSVEEQEPPSRRAALPARLGVIALVGCAPAATVFLAFSNGGYFPNAVGITAICICAALVLRTTLADRPFEGYSRMSGVVLVAFGLLAVLQLSSALWSHSTARALDAYQRTLLYVLVLALFGSLPRTTLRVRWLVRSLAVAMTLVCLAGLISRVLPHVWPVSLGYYAERLSFPLGYWNALGLMSALACILLFHLSCSLREHPLVRVGSAAAFPAVATTMLLTYSRGGLAVGILGLIVYAILGRPRGLFSGLLAVIPASVLAVHAGYDAVLLSGPHPRLPAAVAQGHHVAVTVGLAMLAAAGLRAAALLLDRWLARPHRLPVFLDRLTPRMAWAGAALVVLLVLIAIGAPGFVSREYHRFTSNAGPSAAQVRDRLTDPASNGRVVLWQVALRQFDHDPFLGGGAGTYQTYSAQHRTDSDTVTDAHSLYLQTLGESGVLGMILLVVVLVGVVGTFAWRMRGPNRSMYAALFAAALAWAVHSAVDWDWQMPAVTVWLFAAGGLALAARRPRVQAAPSGVNRTALAASFLVIAIAPLLIGFSYQRLRASGTALVEGNCAVAKKKALSSISLLAVRPQTYEILGYCDLQQSYPTEGLTAMRKAVTYDRQDWNYHYGLAIALAANGLNPIPEAKRAVQLNPRNPLTVDELRSFQTAGPQNWAQVSRGVMLEGLQSGSLGVSNL
ncbi:MAG: O-antigen ligase family protein [Solirubrobacteraceae bacterium]